MEPIPNGHHISELTFEYDVASDRWALSDALRELHGLRPGDDATTELFFGGIVESDRPAMLERFEHNIRHSGTHTFTYRVTDGCGRRHRLTYVAFSDGQDGGVTTLSGFAIDITDATRDATREAVAGSTAHRAAIEQAKGAIMLSFGIDEDAAFGLLRGYSSRTNTKLALVAEHIASRLSAPEFSREEPVRALLDVITDLERLHSPEPRPGHRATAPPAG